MTNEEIEEHAEDYEMNCIADVYRDDVCAIPYAYSAQKLEQTFQDGAKWGYDRALRELYEQIEKEQSESVHTTINICELKSKIKDLGVEV